MYIAHVYRGEVGRFVIVTN